MKFRHHVQSVLQPTVPVKGSQKPLKDLLAMHQQQGLHCVKVPKYKVFSGPYFPVFGPEKAPYLDFFLAALVLGNCLHVSNKLIKLC